MGSTVGAVYLVGAGPGDPGLITVTGLDLLRRADVVVYDRLIAPELLSHAPRGAELIDVGKSPGAHPITQDEINRILIDRARRGLIVVRLKGGDPLVFGRGFEELTACRERNVPCVVIPGVSSAFAVPAAAGIPVTLREHVRSVAVLTGSVSTEAEPPPMNYAALASIDTLIVLMGLAPLASLTQSLIEAGRDPDTPAATIERGTRPDQRVVRGTLATLPDAVSEAGLRTPVITVIGEVARYAGTALSHVIPPVPVDHGQRADKARSPDLSLAGKRIMLTRPPSRSRALRRALEQRGAMVIECPLIEIRFPPASSRVGIAHLHAAPETNEAVRRLKEYSWIVFTSAHGVQGFWRRVRAAGLDARAFEPCRIAAVGPATARALQRIGLRADVMPPGHHAQALVEAMARSGGTGSQRDRDGSRRLESVAQEGAATANAPGEVRVLFPGGDRSLNTIEEGLARHGFRVDRVVVYQSLDVDMEPERLQRLAKNADLIVFYSPSAVRQFGRLGGPTSAKVICIGQTTAHAARELKFPSVRVAERADVAALVAAAEAGFS